MKKKKYNNEKRFFQIARFIEAASVNKNKNNNKKKRERV